ncbi:MAG: hypothetical protein GY842_24945 [bacterium]|nr:hypothetical protein [bacterium]
MLGIATPADVTDSSPITGAKQVFMDPADDMALRRTDDDPSVDPLTGNWPELRYATLGHWIPADAGADPYFGVYSTNGDCNTNCDFFRLDMVFDGLVNPPGEVAVPYNPTQYGPNPLFGWVELDIDANENTGGDTDQPSLGYSANVARWGGMPQGTRFVDRISADGEPWGGTFGALPATYRSGQEFFLIFQGDFYASADCVDGNSNGAFESGETWTLGGDFFWRAPGYDPITYALLYRPYVTIRFKHSIIEDATMVSFVYPLDNTAHAALYGSTRESHNFSSSDANSINEAMFDLNLAGYDPPPGTSGHAYRPLLEDWGSQDPLDHLDPWNWRCTFLFGTVLDSVAQGGEALVWTDAWPNVVADDFNGDGLVTKTDLQMLTDYITTHDGEANYDADGQVNRQIDRASFSDRFSMHDGDYDGLVTTNGFPVQDACDYDNDDYVDLEDFRAFQACYSTTPLDPEVLANVGCLDAFDDNGDLDVDLNDFAVFRSVLNGPV